MSKPSTAGSVQACTRRRGPVDVRESFTLRASASRRAETSIRGQTAGPDSQHGKKQRRRVTAPGVVERNHGHVDWWRGFGDRDPLRS